MKAVTTAGAVKEKSKVYDMAYIGLAVVVMAVCSWISIPFAIPFTLQTFGVFLTVGLLGGRRGTIAVLVYILVGAIGLPVFANFRGGLSGLLATSGGYIIGFLGSALTMWGLERVLGRSIRALAVAMVAGLLVCYAFGTVWFMAVYSAQTGAVGLMSVLGWCVFPFIIPDAVKIGLALVLVQRLRKVLPV